MRKALFAVVLVAASFGGGAAVNGPGLRWAQAWDALSDKDFNRQWRHTWFGLVTVDFLLQQYAWHARHHTAQITAHRSRMGW